MYKNSLPLTFREFGQESGDFFLFFLCLLPAPSLLVVLAKQLLVVSQCPGPLDVPPAKKN